MKQYLVKGWVLIIRALSCSRVTYNCIGRGVGGISLRLKEIRLRRINTNILLSCLPGSTRLLVISFPLLFFPFMDIYCVCSSAVGINNQGLE